MLANYVVCFTHNGMFVSLRCRAIGAEDFIVKPFQSTDVQRLRNYVRPTALTPKVGSKRKLPLDLMAEGGGSERRPRLADVAVA